MNHKPLLDSVAVLAALGRLTLTPAAHAHERCAHFTETRATTAP